MVRVYRTPDYVYWRHGTHLEAEVTCVECHGAVAEREVVARETDVTTMLGCRRCHDAIQVYTGCNDCHEPRSLPLLVSGRQAPLHAARAPYPLDP